MRTTGKATTRAGVLAGALLALTLGGCGGNKEQAASEQATMDPAPGAAQQPGGIGAAGGGVGTAGTAAITSYLSQTGADATGQTFPLEGVNFASGSSTLDPAGQTALNEVAMVMKQHPNASVTVTTHVEAGGDAAANRKLAAARAVSVKNALTTAGIPAGQVMTNVVSATDTAAAAHTGGVSLLLKRG